MLFGYLPDEFVQGCAFTFVVIFLLDLSDIIFKVLKHFLIDKNKKTLEVNNEKIIFLILIFSIITATVCISASALDGEYNCPVYIYDLYTQSFFGYGYLYLEGDTTDSIFRLHGYNERDITLDFSAPNEAGTDYYLNELHLNAVNGPGLYGINFVAGPDANLCLLCR